METKLGDVTTPIGMVVSALIFTYGMSVVMGDNPSDECWHIDVDNQKRYGPTTNENDCKNDANPSTDIVTAWCSTSIVDGFCNEYWYQ